MGSRSSSPISIRLLEFYEDDDIHNNTYDLSVVHVYTRRRMRPTNFTLSHAARCAKTPNKQMKCFIVDRTLLWKMGRDKVRMSYFSSSESRVGLQMRPPSKSSVTITGVLSFSGMSPMFISFLFVCLKQYNKQKSMIAYNYTRARKNKRHDKKIINKTKKIRVVIPTWYALALAYWCCRF